MAFIFEYILLDIGAIAVCLVIALYYYFKYAFTYWKKRDVPYVEPIFPFGNFKDAMLMRKTMGEVSIAQYKSLEGHKFGGIYTFKVPGILFRDPDMIKNVLVKDFSHFHDRGFHVNEEVEPLTGHLFMLSGTRWRNLRTKLTPTFTSGKMKMMFQTLVDCGIELENLVDNMTNEGQIIEIKDVLARYSTDVISSCAFGIECNSLKNPDAEFRQWGRKLFQISVIRNIIGMLTLIIPSIIDFLGLSFLDPEVSKYFRQMVRETIEYREKNNVKRNDFLQLLIQLKNKGFVAPDHEDEVSAEPHDTNRLTVDNLAAQAFVFYFAGFETSSTTITFCLYELSLHPDIQQKVREEILTVLEKHEGKLSYDCIMEMNYLDQVVSETLRKYPSIPLLQRVCTNNYQIPGTDVVVEKGIKATIPLLALQHDPKYYPNPEKFDPERFSQEEKQKRHPYVYLPFGEGPRNCIGMRFGLMQTKVGLVSLLSKFQFGVSAKTPIPAILDKKSFFITPAGGMWLQVTKYP